MTDKLMDSKEGVKDFFSSKKDELLEQFKD